MTTLCTAIILSASVALVCLFGPKVYIILFKPEKNRRKTTVDRQRFSSVMKSQYTRSGESATSCLVSKQYVTLATNSGLSPQLLHKLLLICKALDKCFIFYITVTSFRNVQIYNNGFICCSYKAGYGYEIRTCI